MCPLQGISKNEHFLIISVSGAQLSGLAVAKGSEKCRRNYKTVAGSHKATQQEHMTSLPFFLGPAG
jgi:hypothetical protein